MLLRAFFNRRRVVTLRSENHVSVLPLSLLLLNISLRSLQIHSSIARTVISRRIVLVVHRLLFWCTRLFGFLLLGHFRFVLLDNLFGFLARLSKDTTAAEPTPMRSDSLPTGQFSPISDQFRLFLSFFLQSSCFCVIKIELEGLIWWVRLRRFVFVDQFLVLGDDRLSSDKLFEF